MKALEECSTLYYMRAATCRENIFGNIDMNVEILKWN